MPAALLMALLQGSLHTLVTAGLRGTELVTNLNAYLCKSIPASSLVTLFYGELDTSSGWLRYVNAGHNPPFLLRESQAMQRLMPTSLVLGVTERRPMKQRKRNWEWGRNCFSSPMESAKPSTWISRSMGVEST